MSSSVYLEDVFRIRFTIPERDGTEVEAQGIARLEDYALVLEYEDKRWTASRCGRRLRAFVHDLLGMQDALVEEDDDRMRVVAIPFAQLEYLRRRNRFFFATIVVEVDSLRLLRGIPGNKGCIVHLRTGFSQREESRRFVSTVNMRLADYRMADAQRAADNVRPFNQGVS